MSGLLQAVGSPGVQHSGQGIIALVSPGLQTPSYRIPLPAELSKFKISAHSSGVSRHRNSEGRELPLTPSSSTRAGVQSSLVHSFELRASDGAPPRCLREGINGWSKLTKVVLAISEKHCFSVNARLKSASCWTVKIIYSSCLQLLIMNKKG